VDRLIGLLERGGAPPPRDRYRGTMLGLAVGNALGIPVEGRPRAFVRDRYPDGVREIPREERGLSWDDDVAQGVLLAEAILERGAVDPDDLGRRLVRWAEENGRGIGIQTRAVIELLEAGRAATEAARVVWGRRAAVRPRGTGR
jgi:ADP-ribosyl-[dinitrogen reductase] hydrolase